MADTKISDETAAGTLTGAELVLAVQGGANVRTTTGAIAALTSSDWLVTQLTASATLSAVTQIVEVDATAGNVVLTLPSAATSEGVRYIIKQIDSSENTITLDPNGTDQVEAGGAGTNYLLPDSGAVGAWSVYCSGSAWWRSDYITPTPTVTTAPVWSVEQAVSAPTATTDVVKLYAVAVGGRAEPSLFLEDSVVIPMSRTPRRSVSASDSFAARDEIVWVTANTINLTLPSPTNHDGRQYLVIKTHAGANAITLVRTGSESINGTAASFVLTDSGNASRGSWHITTDGTNWMAIGGVL